MKGTYQWGQTQSSRPWANGNDLACSLLARAKLEGASSPCFAASGQRCHSWLKSRLCLAAAGAPQSQWRPGRTAVNEGVQHLVEDTTVPFTMLVGSAFPSVPLQAAAAFGGRHVQTWKSDQQACFSHGKSNFWENEIFHGKSTLSRVIPASPTQKTFWCLWEYFFNYVKNGNFPHGNPSHLFFQAFLTLLTF